MCPCGLKGGKTKYKNCCELEDKAFKRKMTTMIEDHLSGKTKQEEDAKKETETKKKPGGIVFV